MRVQLLAVAALLCNGCPGGVLYPARPAQTAGLPIADPPPSRVVVHLAISAAEVQRLLDSAVPAADQGTVPLLGTSARYSWKRTALEVSFGDGRVEVKAQLVAEVSLGFVRTGLPMTLTVRAEPVLSGAFEARLQNVATEVTVSSVFASMPGVTPLLALLGERIAERLRAYSRDLRPPLAEAYAKIAQPIDLAGVSGGIAGCAELHASALEVAPTVLANGIEKDLAIVIAPSVSLPCPPPTPPPPLPPLANVAALPVGPFTVTVPIVARYDELAQVMQRAFTDGKLYFSSEFPKLYLSEPELYAGADQLVLKLHLAGPVNAGGIHTVLDGDLYMAGHPQVVDNELKVPDLQPTIETRGFLLRLKAALDGDSIRDQARAALRLDLGKPFAAVREQLSTDVAFAAPSSPGEPAGPLGCVRPEVQRIEVTGVYPHASFLRIYVAVTAQAGAYLPCPPKR